MFFNYVLLGFVAGLGLSVQLASFELFLVFKSKLFL